MIAVNDMCALGICAGVRDAGLEVGRDVSVMGFDDIVLADLVYPALTTIRQPLEAMANLSFDHVRRRVEGGTMTGESLLMRPELIVRQSTGPPPQWSRLEQRSEVARGRRLPSDLVPERLTVGKALDLLESARDGARADIPCHRWDFEGERRPAPPANTATMAAGEPLTDDDRWPRPEKISPKDEARDIARRFHLDALPLPALNEARLIED